MLFMEEKFVITSLQNNKVKRLVALQKKSAERRKEGVFVVEGRRELQHCLDAGYEPEMVFCRDDIAVYDSGLGQVTPDRVLYVSKDVYAKMAYRDTTEGVLAIVREQKLTLADLKLPANPLIVVLESVEKPGNLGAVLRSAEAAGASAVMVCDPLTDLYNPNLIRSSIGAIFRVPCVACSSEECIAYLKSSNIQILTAQLQDSSLYYNINMCKPTAIVMGTESTGLTDMWRSAATSHIRIPMLGKLDSLNVSVSAAILLYEAVRQRQKEG